MDQTKCDALKAELAAQPEPQIVAIGKFFDGNDDLGSIGCNLSDHPGVDRFRVILTKLLQRADVEGVYAQISELDPGEDSWPFSDTVLVVGNIPLQVLRDAVAPLQPDEVGQSTDYGEAFAVPKSAGSAISVLWWD